MISAVIWVLVGLKPLCFSAIARSVMISALFARLATPIVPFSFSAIARSVMISAFGIASLNVKDSVFQCYSS